MVPLSLALGDIIAAASERAPRGETSRQKLTFSGATYFERMKAQGLYSTDMAVVRTRVAGKPMGA